MPFFFLWSALVPECPGFYGQSHWAACETNVLKFADIQGLNAN